MGGRNNPLTTVKAFFIPLKLEPYQIESLKHDLEKSGGEVSIDQASANVILTALASAPRVKRHLENHTAPVVKIDWLKECLKKHEHIPMNAYQIQMGRTGAKDETDGPQSIKQQQEQEQPSVRLARSEEVLNRRYENMPPDPLPSFDDEEEQDEELSEETGDGDLASGFLNTKYECLRKTPLKARRNGKLVFLLRLLERQRLMDMQDKNALSYRHAIAAIKAYPRKIQSADEAKQITGIGKKISDLIRIYLETGTIPDAESLLSDTKFRTLTLFNKVFGVGPSTANMWYAKGYRTLQDVLNEAKLVKVVKLGIELIPDLEQPMSRQDVKELIDIVEKEIKVVDSEAFATPVGGYRRGKEENGDLDIVIASHHLKHGTDLLIRKIVDHMIEQGYVKHVLLISDKASKGSPGTHYTSSGGDTERLDTCFTAFLQPSTQTLRQVDFIVTSLEDYACAVLGWSGSQQFERSLRDYAKKEKGLSVKSTGIYKDSTRERIPVKTEEHAFEIIGIPWVDPSMRNC